MHLIGNYMRLSVKVIGDIDYDIVSKKCKVVYMVIVMYMVIVLVVGLQSLFSSTPTFDQL